MAKTIQTFVPIELAALKVLGAKSLTDEVRTTLTPGKDQPVNMLIRVSGMVSVGEDIPAGFTNRDVLPDPKNLLALMLDAMPEGEGAKVLQKIVDANAGLDQTAEASESAQQQVDAVIASLAVNKRFGRPLSRGRVAGMLAVERYDPVVAATGGGRRRIKV